MDIIERITELLSNPYIRGASVLLLSMAILKIFEIFVVKKVRDYSRKTKTDADDLIAAILNSLGLPFYFAVSLKLAIVFIPLEEQTSTVIQAVIWVIIAYYIINGLSAIVDYFSAKYLEKNKEDKQFDEQIINFTSLIAKVAIWLVSALVIASNLGFNVMALVAGLGIAGLAVGVAAQGILGDLFAYFAIFFDKTFGIGDFLKFGNKKGTVRKIGIKTTRLRTPTGDELVVGNESLISKEVHNFGRLRRRRKSYQIGVVYGTPAEKVRKIPEIIENVYKNYEEDVTLDRVHFKDFGDYALIFEIVHFIESSNYTTYMDRSHSININIMDRFEEEGIEFAYPTQTIQIENPEPLDK